MNYFVTGGTGFIGRFLVPRLLDRGGRVYLLVRPGSLAKVDGLRELWGANRRQVVAVEGDLSEPRLGVKAAWIRQHAGKIDHFFHLAAIYDMQASAESQRKSNVEGTRQALVLAKALKTGCFHQVSSIAAAGLYEGTFTEDMFEEAGALDHPYFQTKHESEGIVRAEERLKWRIYRPGMVVGHSVTGEMDKVDGPYYFFETLRSLSKVVPEGLPLLMNKAGLLNIVPVDYVVAAMDHLAHLPGHDRECFFLTDPDGIRVGDLLKTLMRVSHGPKLRAVDASLLDSATRLAGKGIGHLGPVRKLGERLIAQMGIPPQVVAYINYPTHFDSTRTRALLEPAAIQCPPFEEYAPVIWDYWLHFLRKDAGALEKDVDTLFDRLVGRPTLAALRKRVKGKVVVVTGATSGIGRECALRLARADARVVLVARTVEKLEETIAAIEEQGGVAHAYACDVADLDACDKLVTDVTADFGGADILINNAGRSIRRSVRYSYDRFHDFERTMQLNYFGALRLIMGFLPGMEQREQGQVINISSIGVLTSPPRFSAYVASKAALDAFSLCAAPEFSRCNIEFTTIHMPLVRTPMIAPTGLYKAFPTLSPEQARDLVMKAIVSRPKKVSTSLGVAGAVAQATMPSFTEAFLSQAYDLFPDSPAARGLSAEEAAAELAELPSSRLALARRLFSQVMRGVHW
ncbi:SDR family oxidoreductase [Haliea sp.]|jgi:NAD(P)-dependent dehydrogenase (short-subunit alcohol dehydrogenase family)|uniref:SDR family oxidoreductase n=1 Tax=Haliea TaxID=475794 RepID=UPI000C53AAD0|nr:SDR family oxidoreductase [Haliea sp.]MAD65368.1 short chain dehydrogenase [Haliea sp.]MAY91841.1 short chain dehydrogenase [Haliea sp.]MBK42231.1 short chain dehydrogenase [Haliea sp.]MBP69314.1 short chain dehydrogenase [Haliea sp.]|tara:strand:- start:297 stop:2357 length:2061 start_codon:yes stop_codon:yes gene_type:complete